MESGQLSLLLHKLQGLANQAQQDASLSVPPLLHVLHQLQRRNPPSPPPSLLPSLPPSLSSLPSHSPPQSFSSLLHHGSSTPPLPSDPSLSSSASQRILHGNSPSFPPHGTLRSVEAAPAGGPGNGQNGGFEARSALGSPEIMARVQMLLELQVSVQRSRDTGTLESLIQEKLGPRNVQSHAQQNSVRTSSLSFAPSLHSSLGTTTSSLATPSSSYDYSWSQPGYSQSLMTSASLDSSLVSGNGNIGQQGQGYLTQFAPENTNFHIQNPPQLDDTHLIQGTDDRNYSLENDLLKQMIVSKDQNNNNFNNVNDINDSSINNSNTNISNDINNANSNNITNTNFSEMVGEDSQWGCLLARTQASFGSIDLQDVLLGNSKDETHNYIHQNHNKIMMSGGGSAEVDLLRIGSYDFGDLPRLDSFGLTNLSQLPLFGQTVMEEPILEGDDILSEKTEKISKRDETEAESNSSGNSSNSVGGRGGGGGDQRGENNNIHTNYNSSNNNNYSNNNNINNSNNTFSNILSTEERSKSPRLGLRGDKGDSPRGGGLGEALGGGGGLESIYRQNETDKWPEKLPWNEKLELLPLDSPIGDVMAPEMVLGERGGGGGAGRGGGYYPEEVMARGAMSAPTSTGGGGGGGGRGYGNGVVSPPSPPVWMGGGESPYASSREASPPGSASRSPIRGGSPGLGGGSEGSMGRREREEGGSLREASPSKKRAWNGPGGVNGEGGVVGVDESERRERRLEGKETGGESGREGRVERGSAEKKVSASEPPRKQRQKRGTATDPHSVAARMRRDKISQRMRTLHELVPGAARGDTVTMLEAAIQYVRQLQDRLQSLSGSDSNIENSSTKKLSCQDGQKSSFASREENCIEKKDASIAMEILDLGEPMGEEHPKLGSGFQRSISDNGPKSTKGSWDSEEEI